MGWQNAFHCEIDDFCNTILNYWFKDAKSYTDVATTDFREWRGKINVLTGGFPCQPFSVAGQRKGADDNRYLWPHMLRAIHEIRPDWVIGENVAGILTMVQPGQETEVGSQSTLFGESEPVFKRRQQYVVETICRDLEREGDPVFEGRVQLSQDGIHWADDGSEPTIFKGLGQHIIKVNSNFGNYIRLAVSIEGGEMFLNLHIACKG